MRVIFLEAVQNFGGSKRSVISMASTLAQEGVEVLIVDFWAANSEFNDAVRDHGLAYQALDPSTSYFIVNSSGLVNKVANFLRYLIKRLRYKKMFNRIASQFKPDFVCVNSMKTLDILSAKDGYSVDYYVRGWTLSSSLKSKYVMRRFAPRFIAISEATRHALYLQNNVPLESIKVVKTAVDSPVPVESLESVKKFGFGAPINLLHAGTFVKTKGHHVSIMVARALKERDVNFKMKIAGLVSASPSSKAYLASLQCMVQKLGLTQHIEFIINNHDLSEEMASAHVLVNPSHSEGLSRVCLEAMSWGKPVISNPVGGVTDIVVNGLTGFLVDFNSVEGYVDRITRYYKDYALYERHCKQALAMVRSGYLKCHLRESLMEVYKQC